LIEAYVLFSLGDAGIARDYEGFRTANRSRLEEYLERFVVPAASVQRARRAERRWNLERIVGNPEAIHMDEKPKRTCGYASAAECADYLTRRGAGSARTHADTSDIS
jgi:hypothetical protein